MGIIIPILIGVLICSLIFVTVLYVFDYLSKGVYATLLISIPIIFVLTGMLVWLSYKEIEIKESAIQTTTTVTRLTSKDLSERTNVYFCDDSDGYYIYETVRKSNDSYNIVYVITKVDVNKASFEQLEKIMR